MDAKEHEWFSFSIKGFKALEVEFRKMSAGFESLRNQLIAYDNKAQSLENAVKAKQAELELVEKKIKDQMRLTDSNTASIREQLNRKHGELMEREALVKAKEDVIAQRMAEAQRTVARAESVVAVAKEYVPPAPPVVEEKRGRGRPRKEVAIA